MKGLYVQKRSLTKNLLLSNKLSRNNNKLSRNLNDLPQS
jgi:hypothetical protein